MDGDGQGKDVQAETAVLDEGLNAQAEHGQPHHRVDPHGIVLLDHAVGGQGVHDREGHDHQAVGLSRRMLMEVDTHEQTAQSRLDEEQDQQSLQHEPLGEEGQEHGEGGSHVVVVDAQKLTAQIPREGVEQVGLAPQNIVKPLVEGDVLAVQVQHQHGTVPEGVELLGDEVHEVEQYHGNEDGKEQVAVLPEGLVKECFPTGLLGQHPVFQDGGNLPGGGGLIDGIHFV